MTIEQTMSKLTENHTEGRFKIRVKLPDQTRARTVERLHTRMAALAVLREFYSFFKRAGFTCRKKPTENYKHHMFRRNPDGSVDLVTLELSYHMTEEDYEERFRS